MNLNEIQLDLLKEVFNLGVGKAAASLSALANNKYEVTLSLPKVELVTIDEMVKILKIESDNKITTVSQDYSGPFSGTAHMIYSHTSSLRLVSLMLGSSVPHQNISELEEDALMEIGNILINSCLDSLSQMFQEDIETSLPKITIGTPLEVFIELGTAPTDKITFIKSYFNIEEENLKGYISLFLDTDHLHKLLELIDKYNDSLMG